MHLCIQSPFHTQTRRFCSLLSSFVLGARQGLEAGEKGIWGVPEENLASPDISYHLFFFISTSNTISAYFELHHARHGKFREKENTALALEKPMGGRGRQETYQNLQFGGQGGHCFCTAARTESQGATKNNASSSLCSGFRDVYPTWTFGTRKVWREELGSRGSNSVRGGMRVPGQWPEQRLARGWRSRERTCGKAMAGEELRATVCMFQ